MKYFLILFVSTFLLTSCDDGDLITESFNFDNATIQKCSNSNVLYKINDQEALILNTPETSFPNIEEVVLIPITGTTSIVYRKYASTTNVSNICGTPTLTVNEEFNVSGGDIQITRTKINDTNGITVAYNHAIVFKNITFVNAEKQIAYNSYVFGNYRTEIVDLNFDYSLATTQKCIGNNLIFKYNNTNALLLNLDPSLFPNSVVGSPRTRVINNTTNKVVYRVYNGSLNTNFFCGSLTPSTPILTEEWVAEDGVTGISGEIRVVTVAVGATFRHTISLYKTTFKKGVLTYIYPDSDNFVFGTYITTP